MGDWPATVPGIAQSSAYTVPGPASYVIATPAQLMDMKAGDILPCDFSGRATVLAEDVPVFRGTFGVSHGQQAVQIEERVARSKSKTPDVLMLSRK